ncbi:MAG: LysM peptidoglycan-binding domain-containing protein [Kribbellaceae bacterium]|nr:LysM peptidoglycan-binding domain-containing protein [Kribbellaceae bacterium]
MLGRIMRALGAMLATIAVFVGMPVGLHTFGHNPWPAFAAFAHDPMMRDDGTFLLAVITVVGWAAWAYFILGLLIELAGRMSGRGLRVPGLGPAQLVAAFILATITTTSVASTIANTRAAASHTPTPRPHTVAVATVQHDDQDKASDAATAVAAQQETYVTHVVQRGETMIGLAERYYHDGNAITRIIDANIGLPQPGGTTLKSGEVRIYPGWTLRIPSPVVNAASTTETPPSLAPASDHQAATVYQTRHGDYLWFIAERFLGDPERYAEIAECNPGLIADPDLIEPGWHLNLPADAHDTGTRAHATGTVITPTEGDVPSKSATPVAPPLPQPTDSVTPQTAPAATPASPSAPTTAPSAHTPVTTADNVADDPQLQRDPTAHVALPSGGWITTGLAVAVTTALLIARINRRRKYQPQFPIPISHTPAEPQLSDDLRTIADAGLTELKGTLEAPGSTEPEPETTSSIAVTSRGDDLSLHEHLTGLTVLSGAGAPGAARAIVAAALTSSIRRWGKSQADVYTDASTLSQLLDDAPIPEGVQRLHLNATTDATVDALEHEIVYRANYLAMYGADDIKALDANPDHVPLELGVWITPAGPATAPRIVQAARQGHRLGIDIFVLGDLAGHPAAQVADDGHLAVEDDSADVHPVLAGGRIATLSSTNLTEVLGSLASAVAHREPSIHDEQPAQYEIQLDQAGDSSTDEPAETVAPQWFAPARETAAPVTLRVLGPARLSTATVDHITFGRDLGYPLLTRLASHPQGRTLEQLVVDLGIDERKRNEARYRGMDPATRAKAELTDDLNIVKSTIYAIRKRLKESGAQDGTVYLPCEGSVYRLDPKTVEVDLWRMHAHMADANIATDDDTTAAALDKAVACYTGEFAADIDTTWATDRADLYRSQVLDAYKRLVEILESEQPERALAYLHDALEVEPVNESLYQTIMRIHGRHGRIDAVERTMALLQDRLVTLIDTAEPSAATKGVYERMRALQDATIAR